MTGKFAADAVIYARDDHASTFQQMRLARDLHKATGGTLWLEFIYEESLEEVRKAFATQSKEDDAEALAAVLKSLEHNGWSVEFNTSMVNLLTVAWKHSINVHALDDPEWSKDSRDEAKLHTLFGVQSPQLYVLYLPFRLLFPSCLCGSNRVLESLVGSGRSR